MKLPYGRSKTFSSASAARPVSGAEVPAPELRYRYGDAEAGLLEARGHEPRHRRAHNNLGLVRAAWGHSKRPAPRSCSAGLLESGGPAC